MCGRFVQAYSWDDLRAFLGALGTPRNLQPRYNIAPTTLIDVIRLNEAGTRELVTMRWGLVPFFWKKSLKDVPATFNARAESVAEKPMFRAAYARRRCVIPASGFFEWTGAKAARQPHYFTANPQRDGDSPLLAFAGLWEEWREPVGIAQGAAQDTTASDAPLLSCTMVVSGANAWMQRYHDRMPVLLHGEDVQRWLDGTLRAEHLQPAAETALREWRVSPRVNRAGQGDDDAATLAPLQDDDG